MFPGEITVVWGQIVLTGILEEQEKLSWILLRYMLL